MRGDFNHGALCDCRECKPTNPGMHINVVKEWTPVRWAGLELDKPAERLSK